VFWYMWKGLIEEVEGYCITPPDIMFGGWEFQLLQPLVRKGEQQVSLHSVTERLLEEHLGHWSIVGYQDISASVHVLPSLSLCSLMESLK